MTPLELQHRLTRTAFAFRGYNVTNLGRSAELLTHPQYGPVVRNSLDHASRVCAEMVGRQVDLADRVASRQETTLESYAEAIAIIVAMERAQLECLSQFFAIQYDQSQLSFGYSLGEIAAVAASGVISWEDSLRIPLSLASDCATLANNVHLGILFSRELLLPVNAVRQLCLEINEEGRGVVAMSARLSPNSVLMMGQQDTLDRFKARMHTQVSEHVNLRRHSAVFPPLHTPIVWERSIPARAGLLMHTMRVLNPTPNPPVFSLVTSRANYGLLSVRETLQQWTDHPQMLWDAVQETLVQGTELVVHVGPEPNLIPATYKRLRDNVQLVTKARFDLRAVQVMLRGSWLTGLLPERAALLRAPMIEHLILEDWLLENNP